MDRRQNKHANSGQVTDPKGYARSKIGNGSDVLPNVDGRSMIIRRFKEISNALAIDSGGVDQCSESRLQLIRRFSACAVLAEQMEARLANGENISIERHALLVSSMVRITRQLGINRVAKNITGLGELLRADFEQQRQAVQEPAE